MQSWGQTAFQTDILYVNGKKFRKICSLQLQIYTFKNVTSFVEVVSSSPYSYWNFSFDFPSMRHNWGFNNISVTPKLQSHTTQQNIFTFENFCKLYYSFCLFLFVCLQHNSTTTAQIVMKVLGSSRIITGKNWFKFGHNWVNILDSGGIFDLRYQITQNEWYTLPKILQSLHMARLRDLLFFFNEIILKTSWLCTLMTNTPLRICLTHMFRPKPLQPYRKTFHHTLDNFISVEDK